MRSNVKKRWFMVAVVWAGVLVLNFWTMEKIDRIQDLRTQKEILERDHRFWKDNAAQISDVLHRNSSLTQNCRLPETRPLAAGKLFEGQCSASPSRGRDFCQSAKGGR